MKITCKQCGIVITVDSQDADLHPGLCDICMNTVPATVEFVPDNQPNINTQMEPQEQEGVVTNPIQPEVETQGPSTIEQDAIAEEAETLIEEISLPQSEGEVLEVPTEEPVEGGEQPEEPSVEETVPVIHPTPVQE